MPARERALFVATAATASVVGGLESSARNRGHNAISVVDPTHAGSLARAFRPSVMVLLAPADQAARVATALLTDKHAAAIPLVILTPPLDPASVVGCYAAGASALEAIDGGANGLERAFRTLAEQTGFTAVERAVDAFVKRGIDGTVRVSGPVDGAISIEAGAVSAVRCGKDTDLAALARIRDAGNDVAMSFEALVPRPRSEPDRDMIDDVSAAFNIVIDTVTVLVVEDDPEVSRMYALMLEHEGLEVTTATDGFAGFEAALARRPDVIVTDIAMPKSDGWELLGRLRDDVRVREIPVVMLSNFTEILGQLAGLRVGADAYLEKAGPKAELVAVVRALAERRRSAKLVAATQPAPCGGRLEDIGPTALLLALEEGKRSGTLTVAAGWGTVTVAFLEGVVTGARAQLDEVELVAADALLLLLDLGETTWHFEDTLLSMAGGPNALFSTLQHAYANRLNARKAAAAAAAATRRDLNVVEERARVYVGTSKEARAVIAKLRGGGPIGDDVRATLRDLVRRGIARA